MAEPLSRSGTRSDQMFLKIHRSSGTEVVGICDRELLGSTITDGELQIVISPSFFGDTQVTEEQILDTLKNSANVTMFGKRCTALAIKHGCIEESGIRMIGDIPSAIIIRL